MHALEKHISKVHMCEEIFIFFAIKHDESGPSMDLVSFAAMDVKLRLVCVANVVFSSDWNTWHSRKSDFHTFTSNSNFFCLPPLSRAPLRR